jgi:ATP-binding cassette subfamily F protein 2
MVSASKAAREAKRAAEGKAPKKTAASRAKGKDSENASGASSVAGDETPPLNSKNQDEIKRLADQMDKHGLSDRVTTGVLSSLKASRDVKITSVSLVFHGRVLIQDATMELTYGRRYGLLGENGCGKSTLMKAIDKREFPIPGK